MLVVDAPWRLAVDDLDPPTFIEFEGLRVPAPRCPSVLLHEKYGDYMTLPPPHLRVAPHHGAAYWIHDDPRATEPP
jgi:hypothetical protein